MGSARRISNRELGNCSAAVARNMFKVDWTSKADYMASSVAGCNTDGFFLCVFGTLEGGRLVQSFPGPLEISWQDYKQL